VVVLHLTDGRTAGEYSLYAAQSGVLRALRAGGSSMSAEDDKKATQLVLDVLKHKAISKIKFTMDKFTVGPSLYAKVAQAIGKKELTIMVNALPAGIAAKYFPKLTIDANTEFYDLIVLPSPALGSGVDAQFHAKAAIVHECTHAGFDLLKTKMNHMQNEALAYVAGASFVIAHMVELKGDPTKVTVSATIEKEAWDIAMLLHNGKKVPKESYNALLLAIENHPEYKADAKKAAENDGVGRAWKLPKAPPTPKPAAGATR
jgi:hypothetical protein